MDVEICWNGSPFPFTTPFLIEMPLRLCLGPRWVCQPGKLGRCDLKTMPINRRNRSMSNHHLMNYACDLRLVILSIPTTIQSPILGVGFSQGPAGTAAFLQVPYSDPGLSSQTHRKKQKQPKQHRVRKGTYQTQPLQPGLFRCSLKFLFNVWSQLIPQFAQMRGLATQNPNAWNWDVVQTDEFLQGVCEDLCCFSMLFLYRELIYAKEASIMVRHWFLLREFICKEAVWPFSVPYSILLLQVWYGQCPLNWCVSGISMLERRNRTGFRGQVRPPPDAVCKDGLMPFLASGIWTTTTGWNTGTTSKTPGAALKPILPNDSFASTILKPSLPLRS